MQSDITFLRTNDVTKFLKQATKKELLDIIQETLSYPNYNEEDVSNPVMTTLEYDGTVESFQTAISKLNSENKVMQSMEIEWIGIILKHFEDFFGDYCVDVFKGLLISKNELPYCYIRNKSQKANDTTRYIKLTYSTLRKIITNITVHQRCLDVLSCRETNKYLPRFENVKSFVFGSFIGVMGVVAIAYKWGDTISSSFAEE